MKIIHKICISMLFLILSLGMFAQVNIKGKIVNDKNEPIEGVSIQIEKTNFGTNSKQDGSFEFNPNLSKGNFVLVFTALGYNTLKYPINTSNKNNFLIETQLNSSSNTLDDIIVVGSSLKSKKRELGNAITSISGKELEKSGSANFLNSLQGKVLGAQITQNSGDPAGGVTIRIRGVKSLQGSSDPLYIIDGIIISNNSTNVNQPAVFGNQIGAANAGTNRNVDVNPNDIESMNIINGAAAAAQYGSRAANGVVIITTKKGKSGAPKFNFTTSVTSNELRKKVPITTYGKQFGKASFRLNTINFLDGGSPAVTIATAATNGITYSPFYRNGGTQNLPTNLVDVTRYDYQDLIFRTGVGTENNLSMSGGNENTQYYSSISYSKNEGIIKGTDFSKFNFKTRIDQKINNWAKISAGISYINSFANEKSNGNVFYSPINSIWITNNIYDINKRDGLGNLLSVEPSRVNPLSTIEDMNFTQEVNRTINNLQLTLTPIKNLTFDWIVGVDYYNQVGRSFIKPYPYQSVSNLPLERFPNGFAANATNSVLLYNNDINVSYLYDITNDFKLNAIAGFSYQFSKSEYVRASGEGLAPFIETVSGATNNFGVGYGLDKYDLSGVFGQATFSFKNLAFITGAIRQDKSSKFSINQSTQTYPKFSGSFILSDLKFYKNSSIKDIINSIKLRSSWGQAGNLAGIGSFDRFWQYNPISYLGKNTIIPSSALANQDVRPEKTTEFEYGFDLSFLNNKINVIANFYNQQIADLIVNRTLASSTGGLSIVNNVGEMENKGIELMLQVNPIKSNNFNWEFSIIYSSNTNKIIKLGTPSIAISNAAGAPVYLFEGQPASVFYGTFYARDASGNYILTPQGFTQTQKGAQLAATPLSYTPSTTTDNYGISGSEVRKIIGNPNPSYTSSFSNSLTYKNLTFSFLIDMVQGVSVFNADKRTRQGVGIGDLAEKEYKGLVPRGTIYSIYLNEEWRIDDGSFIKLREVSLSYNLNILKSKLIKNASISLIGRNLISWDNYNGYDPETNAGGNNDILRGVDFGNVPIPKTYRLQFNLNF